MPNKNISKNATLNSVSVYNDKNKHHHSSEEVVNSDENGIVGLAFHQSKDLNTDDNNKIAISKEQGGRMNRAICKRMNKITEDCSDCFTPSCSFSPFESLNRLRALTIKNFIVMWRNIGFMLFIFVLPAIQVILFCLAIGREPLDMKFGVVNHEVPGLSICHGPAGCTTQNLSCRYLDNIPKASVNLVPYLSEEDAIDDIHKGHVWGYISFPNNFSAYMESRAISGSFADNETIYGSRVKVQMDMSNQQIAFSMQRILLDTFRQFSRQLLADCDQDPIGGDLPLYFANPIYGDNHPSFMEFMAPGIVLSIIFFMAVALTGSAFVTEKKEGMLDRSLVAGVTTGEVITAHMITQYVVMVGQTSLVLLFMIVVFEVPVRGPLGWAIIITLLQGTCGMAFGFLISTVCNEERNAIQLALGSFYPNLLLSGVVWPIESMPKLLREISYILPETLACESMRSMLTRGWGITHPSVWPGFLSSIIWSVIFWILAILVARFSRSK
jgi:ABC-type multidrug transport system permease subunit